MPASFSTTNYVPDALLIDGDNVHSKKITLILGQNLVRGAVLGKITASGKYTLSLSASADGSQTPDAILAEDTNATAADVPTIGYFSAAVRETGLTLGAGHTLASIYEGLRVKGIFLQAIQPAV